MGCQPLSTSRTQPLGLVKFCVNFWIPYVLHMQHMIYPLEEAAHVQWKATTAKKANAQLLKKIKKPTKLPTKSKGTGPTSNIKSSSWHQHHALGWYPRAIHLYGTSDNYSTQTVHLFLLILKVGSMCINFLFIGWTWVPASEKVLQTHPERKACHQNWMASQKRTSYSLFKGMKLTNARDG